MLTMILPPNEVRVKYSNILSNFHQKSWKVIKKEHYHQDGYNLGEKKRIQKILLFFCFCWLPTWTASFDFGAFFIVFTSCYISSPCDHEFLQKTLVEVDS